MEKEQKFEDLEIFKKARRLSKDIYLVTNKQPFANDIRFVLQMHASVGSIMDNIAEGFERNGNKEFVQFLYIAKGSCGEVRSQIIRASDIGFLDKVTTLDLYDKSITLSREISAFIRYLKTSGYKGVKYLSHSDEP